MLSSPVGLSKRACHPIHTTYVRTPTRMRVHADTIQYLNGVIVHQDEVYQRIKDVEASHAMVIEDIKEKENIIVETYERIDEMEANHATQTKTLKVLGWSAPVASQ